MEICSKELGCLYDIGDRPERRWRWFGHVLRMHPFSLSLSLSLSCVRTLTALAENTSSYLSLFVWHAYKHSP